MSNVSCSCFFQLRGIIFFFPLCLVPRKAPPQNNFPAGIGRNCAHPVKIISSHSFGTHALHPKIFLPCVMAGPLQRFRRGNRCQLRQAREAPAARAKVSWCGNGTSCTQMKIHFVGDKVESAELDCWSKHELGNGQQYDMLSNSCHVVALCWFCESYYSAAKHKTCIYGLKYILLWEKVAHRFGW